MPASVRIAFLAGLLSAAGPATRADNPKPVELLPNWKKGEVLEYEMTQSKVHEKDGKVVRKNGARTPVRVEVLEAGEKGYVLRWTQGEPVSDDPKIAEHPQVKAIARLASGLKLELQVDTDGEFLGLRNWKEVQQDGKKMLDGMFAELAKAGEPKAKLDAIRGLVDDLLATKEAVEASFARQAGLLFIGLGHTYDPSRPAAYDSELPNPFGGDPLPVVTELTLKKVDPAGVATVSFKQRPDPKAAAKVVEAMVRDMAKKLGKPVDESFKLPAMALEDGAEVAVDVKTGWVRSVTHTRRVGAGPETRTETTTLTRRAK